MRFPPRRTQTFPFTKSAHQRRAFCEVFDQVLAQVLLGLPRVVFGGVAVPFDQPQPAAVCLLLSDKAVYFEDIVSAILFFALGWTTARAGRRRARAPCTTARSRLLLLLLVLQQLVRRRRLFTCLLCCVIEPLHWLRALAGALTAPFLRLLRSTTRKRRRMLSASKRRCRCRGSRRLLRLKEL